MLADSVRRTADGLLDAVVFTSAPGVHAWLDAASDDDLVAIRRAQPAPAGSCSRPSARSRPRPWQAVGLVPLVPGRWRLGAVVRELVTHYARAAT